MPYFEEKEFVAKVYKNNCINWYQSELAVFEKLKEYENCLKADTFSNVQYLEGFPRIVSIL